jgi:hypothetical protein
VEVNRPDRRQRRMRGKSDPPDAENAARGALAAQDAVVSKNTITVVESIRALRIARHGVVKARSAALNQLKDLITTAPDDLWTSLRGETLRRPPPRPRGSARTLPDRAITHVSAWPLQATTDTQGSPVRSIRPKPARLEIVRHAQAQRRAADILEPRHPFAHGPDAQRDVGDIRGKEEATRDRHVHTRGYGRPTDLCRRSPRQTAHSDWACRRVTADGSEPSIGSEQPRPRWRAVSTSTGRA